jgi:tRNA/tmRNA/rRNA uracil-C5-methylase (TrmA/RlmC/RlmD family)
MAVEVDPRGAQDARRSLHDLPQVQLEAGTVERVLPQATQVEPWAGSADVVVLDPPRAGAGRAVVTSIAALSPRVVVYVACDPAALARDVNTFAGLGYRLSGLRAFDTFPLTHHVECVATFTPDTHRGSDPDPEVS